MPQSKPSTAAMEVCVRWIQSNGEANSLDSSTRPRPEQIDLHHSAFNRWKHVKVWLRFALHTWHSHTIATISPSPSPSIPTSKSAPLSSAPVDVGVEEVYVSIQVLGKGAFGTVVLSRKASTNTLVAIKSVDKAKVCAEESARLLTERTVLSSTQHPFVISLDAAFESPSHYHFVLEYCPGGDLYGLLEHQHRLDVPVVVFYTASILSALLYMHQVCGIVYRDLKPENILLDAKGFIRLSDFGLAKTHMLPSTITYSFCGSVDYMAPELIAGCGYGLAADVWSLGCVVFEMLTGLPPFYTTAGRRVLFERICSGHVVYPPHMPSDACNFVAHCLQLDPLKRWSVSQLLDHPFVAGIDRYQLGIHQVPVPFVPALDHMEDTRYFGDQFKCEPVPHAKLVLTTKRNKQQPSHVDDFSSFDWCRDSNAPTSAV